MSVEDSLNHKDGPGGAECDDMADLDAAESCALDEDEDEEEDDIRRVSSSVTVPIIKTAAGKSFGLVNKIRSMAASKVFAVMKLQ